MADQDCPTPKACREHCCHGACLPAPQRAEPVQQRIESLVQRLRAKGYEAEDAGSAVENIKDGGND